MTDGRMVSGPNMGAIMKRLRSELPEGVDADFLIDQGDAYAIRARFTWYVIERISINELRPLRTGAQVRELYRQKLAKAVERLRGLVK